MGNAFLRFGCKTSCFEDPSVKKVHNKFPTHYALFFSTKKKACQEKIYRTEIVFGDKNFQFLSPKTNSVLKNLFKGYNLL